MVWYILTGCLLLTGIISITLFIITHSDISYYFAVLAFIFSGVFLILILTKHAVYYSESREFMANKIYVENYCTYNEGYDIKQQYNKWLLIEQQHYNKWFGLTPSSVLKLELIK